MNKEKTLLPGTPIRALWWKQPFASLMLHGKIETRIWPTDYRGYVLICASKKEYSLNEIIEISGEKQNDRIIETINAADYIFPHNGIAVAVGKLVDCRPMQPIDSDDCFVEYVSPWISISKKTGKATERQLWCHVYEDVREIEPFELSGCQGWLIINSGEPGPITKPEIWNKIKFK